jgi:hypothetical protein
MGFEAELDTVFASFCGLISKLNQIDSDEHVRFVTSSQELLRYYFRGKPETLAELPDNRHTLHELC